MGQTYYSYNADAKQGTGAQIVMGGERYKASDGRAVCAPTRVLKFTKGILHLTDEPGDAEAVALMDRYASQPGSGITKDVEQYNKAVMTDRDYAAFQERKSKTQTEEINRLRALGASLYTIGIETDVSPTLREASAECITIGRADFDRPEAIGAVLGMP